MQLPIQRTLSQAVIEASESFKVLLLTGPRQVGKTTLLHMLEENSRSYLTLDDLDLRALAQRDPAQFVDRLKLPVLIDEVQYAPELFPYIKMVVDKQSKRGQFWLTGSQQFEMMENITESLAGRVAVLKLQGISLAEEQGRAKTEPFLPDEPTLNKREAIASLVSIPDLFYKIWRGGYPDVVIAEGKNWERFYESHLATYIQRDIRDHLKINDQALFYRFMQTAAARTGQLLNYTDMARDVGVSEVTIKSWLRALEASGTIYLLQPYFNNHTKRLVKTPKLYFLDTGLCSFLTGWLSSDVLERGAMAGAMLETYVVSELIKSYWHNGRIARFYFYRDKDMNEIDVLIEQNGMLYPIEIKKAATVSKQSFKAFQQLDKLALPVGPGGVLCFTKTIFPISETVNAIPIWMI